MHLKKILSGFLIFTLIVFSSLFIPLQFGGRRLSKNEILIAESIFGESVDLDKIVIKYGGPLTWIYPGVTVGNIISFPKGKYDEMDPNDQALLLHEITHVWQFQNEGYGYIPSALYAEVFTDAYVIHYDESKSFFDYDVEEQGEIVAEYFLTGDSRFEPYIQEIQKY